MKMPTDKSWYGKMAAKEGDHEISSGRRLTSTINPTPEEVAEFERLQLEALPTWARDRISQQDAELERLRREIAEADRRAGAAEREMAQLKTDAATRRMWLDDAKRDRGYSIWDSFDKVWAETCALADEALTAKAEETRT